MPPAVDNIDFDVNLTTLINEIGKQDDQESDIPSIFDECDLHLIIETGTELMTNLSENVISKHFDDGVETFLLPDKYLQGVLSGHNGTNACTVIALLAAYCIVKLKDIPTFNLNISSVLALFTGSMEIGNITHEGNDLPLFCTVVEEIQ